MAITMNERKVIYRISVLDIHGKHSHYATKEELNKLRVGPSGNVEELETIFNHRYREYESVWRDVCGQYVVEFGTYIYDGNKYRALYEKDMVKSQGDFYVMKMQGLEIGGFSIDNDKYIDTFDIDLKDDAIISNNKKQEDSDD